MKKDESMKKLTVAALYEFRAVDDPESVKHRLEDFLNQYTNIKGSLLIGNEGINGTVAGDYDSIQALKEFLGEALGFMHMEYKESTANDMPFYRMKIKLKKEIVTLGVDGISPTVQRGKYVHPKEWNDLIQDPETIVIDTRNDYEVRIGSFKNAVNPHVQKFTDFPKFVEDHKEEWKNKKIAMYCTGGIRCEKSTALMKTLGFEDVYHLKGGILKYLEEIPQKDSLWEGVCYVFDHRTAVDHGLALTAFKTCGACREPLSKEEQEHPHYEEGVSCPHCYGKRSQEQLKAARDRQFQMMLAQKRGTLHLGSQHRLKKTAVS